MILIHHKGRNIISWPHDYTFSSILPEGTYIVMPSGLEGWSACQMRSCKIVARVLADTVEDAISEAIGCIDRDLQASAVLGF